MLRPDYPGCAEAGTTGSAERRLAKIRLADHAPERHIHESGVMRQVDAVSSLTRADPYNPADSLEVDRNRMSRDNGCMDREDVIAILRLHESELRAAGITRLSLFGSTARGDHRPDSDIDLLAAFDGTRRISLLAVVGIERQISRMLGRAVDLVEEGTMKPRVRKNVESEAVRAF